MNKTIVLIQNKNKTKKNQQKPTTNINTHTPHTPEQQQLGGGGGVTSIPVMEDSTGLPGEQLRVIIMIVAMMNLMC